MLVASRRPVQNSHVTSTTSPNLSYLPSPQLPHLTLTTSPQQNHLTSTTSPYLNYLLHLSYLTSTTSSQLPRLPHLTSSTSPQQNHLTSTTSFTSPQLTLSLSNHSFVHTFLHLLFFFIAQASTIEYRASSSTSILTYCHRATNHSAKVPMRKSV